eukprot:scaffold7969_cov56-Attheya_sp.AAC.1
MRCDIHKAKCWSIHQVLLPCFPPGFKASQKFNDNEISKTIEALAPTQWSETLKVQNLISTLILPSSWLDFSNSWKQLSRSDTMEVDRNQWLANKMVVNAQCHDDVLLNTVSTNLNQYKTKMLRGSDILCNHGVVCVSKVIQK